MNNLKVFMVSLVVAALLVGCGEQPSSTATQGSWNVEYHLKSDLAHGGMLFIGINDEIANLTNPTLSAKVGNTVLITLTSTEGIEHDIVFPDFNVYSEHTSGQGDRVTVSLEIDKPGTFPYFCSIPGHREAGMEGNIHVTGEATSGH
jgi:nitrite reductase (NO-forming)